ncbi:MAG: arginine decarboxylase, partial [Christensenellaceae bacterium]|nr:arginine decarboxylase [Christensenellaceae bacterium]
GASVFGFDRTKLAVNTLDIGLSGIEVYDLLRDEYDIQIEFGDIGNILAYLSVGDTHKNIEMLIGALSEIKRRYRRPGAQLMRHEYIPPVVRALPQQAFYAEKRALPLKGCVGRVSADFVMCYPPGIPVVAPGEEITEAIVDYIAYAKARGASLTGPEDMTIERINVLAGDP